MHFASRTATTRLTDRVRIANQISQAARSGDWSVPQNEELTVHISDAGYETWFCIYCNTAVSNYNGQRFMHNHHQGGIQQELCRGIARILGMNPIYS